MERAKIVLIGLFFIVLGALYLVFRSKKDNLAMAEKMASVRASRGLSKYVEPEKDLPNEEIKISSE